MIRKTPVFILLLLLFTALSLASTEGRWLHVRVNETRADGETVSVNLPLELVEAVLPTIAIDELQHGKIHIPDTEIEGIDLRSLLEAVRDAPDTNFVTVQGRDESVIVAKEQGFLVVRVDENDERVRVKIPLEVVDAMLGPDGQELDLLAGLRALADYDGGDLVRVESDQEIVRVWIDSSETGE